MHVTPGGRLSYRLHLLEEETETERSVRLRRPERWKVTEVSHRARLQPLSGHIRSSVSCESPGHKLARHLGGWLHQLEPQFARL